MSGFSTYYAQAKINADFVGTTNKYLALFVADPTDNNVTANEVVGAWYARKQITGWAAPTGTAVSTSNSNQLTFNAVTGVAVAISHWALYDAASSGNLIASGAWSETKTFNVDDVFVVNANELVLTWD